MASCSLSISVTSTILISRLNLDDTFEKYLLVPIKCLTQSWQILLNKPFEHSFTHLYFWQEIKVRKFKWRE